MLKKLTLLSIAFASVLATAQDRNFGYGIHLVGTDFYGPQSGHYFFADRQTQKEPITTKSSLYWKPGIRFSLWKKVNPMLDLNAAFTASTMIHPMASKDTNYLREVFRNQTYNYKSYFEFDVKGNLNILNRETHKLSPYITAGISPNFFGGDFGVSVPVGAGLNINLGKNTTINLESDYRVGISNEYNHLTHSIGIVIWDRKSATKAVVVPPVVIPPVVEEPKKEEPKPIVVDTDGDGIVDSLDKCPSEKGIAKYDGCPIPDTDKDGINDEEDKCPKRAGIAKYNGCPIPDSDKDGINDEEDKCPQVFSTQPDGCPKIKQEDIAKIQMAAKGINFETAKSVIKKQSFVNLDKVVEILKAQPTYKVDINGYTDNVGLEENNQKLSQARAYACKDYFISKGIDAARITATGNGSKDPVADNKTAAGKAKNRRTELKIRN